MLGYLCIGISGKIPSVKYLRRKIEILVQFLLMNLLVFVKLKFADDDLCKWSSVFDLKADLMWKIYTE